MQAVILAAGRGTRLHPITLNRTKAMCPIVGKPIVGRVMDTMISNGIQEFILVISSDDPEINSYFENKSQIEAEIKIVHQNERLGMGHALLQAAPLIHGDFILSSCDNLVAETEIASMLTIWKHEQPNAVLSTLQVGPAEIVRMGIVELEGDWIKRIVEKPTLANAPSDIGSVPLYMFASKLLSYLPEIAPSPRGEYELQDAIQMLIERDGKVRSFKLNNRIDLTTPADLLALNLHYLNQLNPQTEIIKQNVGANTRFIHPIQIEENVIIGSDCVIGPYVYLETGCVIGDRAELKNTVVLRGRNVPEKAKYENQVVY